MHSPIIRFMVAVTVGLLLGLTAYAQTKNAAPSSVSSSAGDIAIEELTTLEYPWGMALLPDERLLITEKPGRLRIWTDGTLSKPVEGVPEVVYHDTPEEQGGLLDVAVDPDFEDNGFIYLSYVEASDEQPSDIRDTGDARFGDYLDLSDNIIRGGAVARAQLQENQLTDLKVIWRQTPKTVSRGHFGHRLVFSPSGELFITSGDRMRFDPAQNLSTNLGKIVRINPDGSIPDDNPFIDQEDARGEVWSYGHRNILAAAIDPDSERFWIFEMGPLGGDEINLIQEGKNYGWPEVSNGSDYGGQTITSHLAVPEFKAPVRSWTPVISPSGALFYQGSLFPDWQGNVLVGGLSSQSLVRLVLDEDRIVVEERIDMQQRIRDLIEMPDGALLVIVDDAEGGLLRLTPDEE